MLEPREIRIRDTQGSLDAARHTYQGENRPLLHETGVSIAINRFIEDLHKVVRGSSARRSDAADDPGETNAPCVNPISVEKKGPPKRSPVTFVIPYTSFRAKIISWKGKVFGGLGTENSDGARVENPHQAQLPGHLEHIVKLQDVCMPSSGRSMRPWSTSTTPTVKRVQMNAKSTAEQRDSVIETKEETGKICRSFRRYSAQKG